MSWIDVYRSIWRLAARRGGRIGDAFLSEVESYLVEALHVLEGWRPDPADCKWLPSLARELRILSRVLSSDVLLEAREYGLDRERVASVLSLLKRLEAESARIDSLCK
ncbi:hypothetical protein [Aeropyrum camini]|uniref:Uncharacterized protein n=1 Tax=Aeropyrum camini SY1 = JCM 12091 TaxID=1198449 RepID=U3TBZ6_9CREN|nr:hypothetical protein [Aeropyrum camini]BAN91062.1 hypothetical protein ACAM_1593 [Aeropyrum camini SY1 = JCM 12091]